MTSFLIDYWFEILILTSITSFLTFFASKFLLTIAIRNNVLDDPNSALFRKHQKSPIPLFGGTAACFVSVMLMSILWIAQKYNFYNLGFISQNITDFRLFYAVIAILFMLIVGYYDDRYQLNPKFQFLAILVSISLIIFTGNIRITNISFLGELNYWVGILLTFIWLGFSTASTKFLDGHDGLVISVGIFNFLTIAHISLLDTIKQPILFLFSLIWSVALATVLYYNFPNAKSYLGEGASEVIGFTIGVLAILSGAKLATALSILGWFILDIFLVWVIRVSEGRNPITSSDRNHWHHRLSSIGLNKIQVLIITWIILIISSFIGVYGDTFQKTTLLIAQFILLILIYIYTTVKQKLFKD
jgi:UDP-GlcNAc:undecaprenyl-phosphate/decaprenyl-phosphate GlcNAc-1-phosphate transferase